MTLKYLILSAILIFSKILELNITRIELVRINGNLNLSRALGDLEYKKDKNLPPEK